MNRPNRISKSSNRTPPWVCLVIERGYPIEFLEDTDLEIFTEWHFQHSEILIVGKSPNGVLNCIGCEPHEIVKSISDSFPMFGIKESRWGVLCSPRIATVAMALLSGAYDYAREAV